MIITIINSELFLFFLYYYYYYIIIIIIIIIIGITKHVNRILADCYRKLFIIKKCFLVINEDILRKLYVSYLRPSLEYGSVIWAPHSDSEIKLLDALQHRVLTLHGHNIVLESLETIGECGWI